MSFGVEQEPRRRAVAINPVAMYVVRIILLYNRKNVMSSVG